MTLIVLGLLALSPLLIGGLAASGHSAVRFFSSEWTAPSGEVTVTIAVSDYGPFAQVVETIPEGFRFVSASLSDAAVRSDGSTIRFTLLDEELFTYTVAVSDAVGQHEFSGIFLDSFGNEEAIGGSGSLNVGAPPPMPTLEPTPTPALTPTPTPTATATPTPEPTPTPSPTPAPTPEPTATPTPEPTLTPVPDPTATATPQPTATAAPTATPVPAATSTPAPTSTPEPTAIPAAQPTVGPPQTATPEPEEDDESPIPMWLFFVFAAGALAIVVGGGVLGVGLVQRRRSIPRLTPIVTTPPRDPVDDSELDASEPDRSDTGEPGSDEPDTETDGQNPAPTRPERN